MTFLWKNPLAPARRSSSDAGALAACTDGAADPRPAGTSSALPALTRRPAFSLSLCLAPRKLLPPHLRHLLFDRLEQVRGLPQRVPGQNVDAEWYAGLLVGLFLKLLAKILFKNRIVRAFSKAGALLIQLFDN